TTVQLGRRKEQIRLALAVRVVIQQGAELFELFGVLEATSGRGEVVAIGAYGGPGALRAAQVAVDDDAGANGRRGVDVRCQPRMLGQLAGVVMVEVAHARARGQQA